MTHTVSHPIIYYFVSHGLFLVDLKKAEVSPISMDKISFQISLTYTLQIRLKAVD